MKLHKTAYQKLKLSLVCLSLILVTPISFADGADPRIIGGTTAAPGSWSSMVSIRTSSGGHNCGGTLIAPDWVLTAAHCVKTPPTSVIIGRHNFSISDGQQIGIKKIIVHPNYVGEGTSNENDIALIQLTDPSWQETAILATPSGMGDFVQSLNSSMTVVGWGVTDPDGFSGVSTTLQQVDVNYFPRYTCNKSDWYGNEEDEVTHNEFCAGKVQGGQDSCQGDSGGPIFFKNSSGEYVQAGIVSWGYGCAVARKPGVYTQLSNYIGWIQSNIPDLYIPRSHQWDTIDGVGNRLALLEDSLHITPLEQFTGDTWQEQLENRESNITSLLGQAQLHSWNGSPQSAIAALDLVYYDLDWNMIEGTKREHVKDRIMTEIIYLWTIAYDNF